MAGNYPDPPNTRFAFDRDGTQGYRVLVGGTTPTALTTAQMQNLNRDNAVYWNIGEGDWYFLFFFPEQRDITHMFIDPSHNGTIANMNLASSNDSTNGIDGIWTGQGTWANKDNSSGNWRAVGGAGIETKSIPNIKWLRVQCRWFGGTGGGQSMNNIHLYGKPTTLTTGNKVEFWHPTLDQPLANTPAHLDWGNRPRSTSETRQFRVKNLSAAGTANGVVVGMEALTDTSPTMVSQHTFSHSGGAFASTVNIGNLAPGAISTPVSIKQDIQSGATLSIWSQRIYADPTSWS
jgi:hypothetical protein